ncbi:MAG: hypothetical protein HY270_01765 [Deltaproteobacteria bacterium]|nr:hypothetical protein [Deltaproteobacteria bacterium]
MNQATGEPSIGIERPPTPWSTLRRLSSKRWLHPAGAFGVALMAYLAFFNAAPDAVVHDDKYFFPGNHSYTWEEVGHFFTEDTWASTGAPSGVYRPLLLLSIAADQYAHKRQASLFHRTNVALHVVATVLLFLFLYLLLARQRAGVAWEQIQPYAVLSAAVAAIAFGIHPIHTEAVDSIFNRSEMLATIGVLAALLVLLRFEEQRRALAWIAAAWIYFAALLCRESPATLPFVAALVLWFFQFEGTPAQRLKRLSPVLLLFIPLALYLILRSHALGTGLAGPVADLGKADFTADVGHRLAMALTMMRESLRMIVWPHPLRTSYLDLDTSGLGLAIGVHLLLGLAFAIAIVRGAPVAAVGLGVFYITLLPSTRLFTDPSISVPVAERYVYLPSAGFAIPVAFGLMFLATRGWAGVAAVAALGTVLSAVLVPLTYQRNQQWHNEGVLFEADFRAAPENSDALRLLTGSYLENQKYAKVVELCDLHLKNYLDNAKLNNHCASAYMELKRFAEAEAAYRRAISGTVVDAVVHANLGRLLARLQRDQEAETEFQLAVDAETDPARKHFRRGQAIYFFHASDPTRRAEAKREFEAAVRLQPRSDQYRQWLSRVENGG